MKNLLMYIFQQRVSLCHKQTNIWCFFLLVQCYVQMSEIVFRSHSIHFLACAHNWKRDWISNNQNCSWQLYFEIIKKFNHPYVILNFMPFLMVHTCPSVTSVLVVIIWNPSISTCWIFPHINYGNMLLLHWMSPVIYSQSIIYFPPHI